MDAQEIKTAVAHQDAQRALTEAPFVNRADPAMALGPDGKPAVSRRAPVFADVPDEQWNDWRWQLSHRVNDLDEIGAILNLTPEEREGLIRVGDFGPKVPAAVQQEVLAAQKAIGAGTLQPFKAGKTPVRDNEGHEVIAAGQALTDAQILQMNWLVEGVQGRISR